MNLDLMRRHRESDVVDAVVIGTGAGGAPLLARLAAAGLSVVALEAGSNRHAHDFTPDETAASDIYWMEERLSGGAMPTAFGGNNSGMGVGGSTLHWGAFCPRADARDLRLGVQTGADADWPLTLDELRPYYEEVERFIGVSGPTPYPWDHARGYPLPPVPRNAPAMLMAKGCAAQGVTATDAPAAVLSRAFQAPGAPDRPACVNCGACHQGCFNGSKTSMDVTYLPYAVAAGAEIRPDCRVHTIERDAAGRITGVVYRTQGANRRQRCAAVIVCAGAIETPRLLLHCGLANASGAVGRNFMAHVATQVWGTFDAETRPNKGYPSSLITEDFLRPPKADFAGGYIVQSLGCMPMTLANVLTRGAGLWGAALVDRLDRYNHLAGIGINGECLAQAGNRLELADEVDEVGMPKAKITFAYGPNEQAIDKHAVAAMTDIWRAAGARDIISAQRSAHTIGTCRMGRDASSAVCDPVGRSFDTPNLWICDNSVFPSSLAANPALTIMALSLRTADAFLGGETRGT